MARPVSIALMLLAVILTDPARAACPGDQIRRCLALGCICVPRIVNDTSERVAGLVLEQWLLASRDASYGSATAVPPAMRKKLNGFVDPAVLDAARFRIDDGSVLGDLGSINLRYGYLAGKHVSAITLIDVIVFRDAGRAADAALWAHELFHVQQFRQWGSREFALRYAQDFSAVERLANKAEERFSAKNSAGVRQR